MASHITLSTKEKLMKECLKLYTDKNGLVAMGKAHSITILPPRREVVILLLGNHSAGKSTFINWFIGENIQKTGVAIETQGFTFIQQGSRRETLLAEAALMALPRFRDLETVEGILNYVSMELSATKQEEFNLVTFIDSPGLVDGGMEYPFDVNEALLLLGKKADLVFVFFDPIGQALCKRTLSVLEELTNARNDGVRFFLSKADEAKTENDCQKVLTQIVQELCRIRGLNRHGLEVKTIFVPDEARGAPIQANHIAEVRREVQMQVRFVVQKALIGLKNDCDTLEKEVDSKINQSSLFSLRISSAAALMASIFVGIIILQPAQFVLLLLIMVIFCTIPGLARRRGLTTTKKSIQSVRDRRDQLMKEYLQDSILADNS